MAQSDRDPELFSIGWLFRSRDRARWNGSVAQAVVVLLVYLATFGATIAVLAGNG